MDAPMNDPRSKREDGEFDQFAKQLVAGLRDWAAMVVIDNGIDADTIEGIGVHLFRCPEARVEQLHNEQGIPWEVSETSIVPLTWVAHEGGFLTNGFDGALVDGDLRDFRRALEDAHASDDPRVAFRALGSTPCRFLRAVA